MAFVRFGWIVCLLLLLLVCCQLVLVLVVEDIPSLLEGVFVVQILWSLYNSAPSSASAAEDMSDLMICAMASTAPLLVG